MSELDHELALTAEQQLALVTLDDVRRAGGGRDHLYDRARAGRIERVAPTVYRVRGAPRSPDRSEEHTSELQSLMRNSYAVFCLKKKKDTIKTHHIRPHKN